ncbi:pentatricopeptide repeat-containing protein At1g66345, mitochondrial-like [Glycine soja]|uniref:Pentatricopeptide repeat-containing protein, mitochondrial isoform A n=1 Tax=Glycine soja TaxID=3848 RepID=A0A445J7C2_GLYSO|nr:pentatricopeptide repeat-containing protein At1g66345, mitochondrial-like [Glycine soja]XP_028248076.1 pentatricopeptide repeat-containing protein At1g66345, mitochondrial-like [Glycine soja]XP_028248077.1 pentatricopeptide repeat-containing protein At1g66345, mitochondrial-like [Glycine soja]XP_028248078.1 pentatricopeptide repeat-containing protein At1g66345, mitochondrial-like [Glycine soja]RZB94312.1 Pentatricopeptide repeat-containing protein, mitochondrial isoform A [Glycine soja]RZB9
MKFTYFKKCQMATKLFFFHTQTTSLWKPRRLDDSVVTALCKSFREGRSWESITQEFRSLHLNDSSVEHVLSQLTDAKAALRFFHWAAKRNNDNNTFHHTTRSYTITINLLLTSNSLTDSRALLESLATRNTDPGAARAVAASLLDTYHAVSTSVALLAVNLLIQTYAKAKLTDVAFDLCRYVEEERGFSSSVSVVSFNVLLHALQRSEKCGGSVWEVYEFMIRRRAYPNATSLRIMIDAICKEGELQKIVDTVDRIIVGNNDCSRSRFRSPAMIVNCGLMLRILGKGRVAKSESDDVVVLLKRLLQKNLLHEKVVYSLVVHAKVVFGNLDYAWGFYLEMVQRGFEGNAFVYTLFIGAFCREGRVGKAIGLLREMQGKGLRPYGETFEHIVVGCAAAEDSEQCVSFFEEMVRVGFVPACMVFNKVVERLCEKGKVEKANGMLTVLLEKGFMPNDVTYAHLMQGYARKEEVQEVLKLYYEMEYRCVSPGLSVFGTIVQCFCRCGKVEDAEKYLRIMKGRLVRPDVSVYQALIDGYMKKGESARALHLRDEMASLEV